MDIWYTILFSVISDICRTHITSFYLSQLYSGLIPYYTNSVTYIQGSKHTTLHQSPIFRAQSILHYLRHLYSGLKEYHTTSDIYIRGSKHIHCISHLYSGLISYHTTTVFYIQTSYPATLPQSPIFRAQSILHCISHLYSGLISYHTTTVSYIQTSYPATLPQSPIFWPHINLITQILYWLKLYTKIANFHIHCGWSKQCDDVSIIWQTHTFICTAGIVKWFLYNSFIMKIRLLDYWNSYII